MHWIHIRVVGMSNRVLQIYISLDLAVAHILPAS